MYSALKSIHHFLSQWGFQPLQLLNALRGMPVYLWNALRFGLAARGPKTFGWGWPLPCLTDRFDPSASLSGHYFHQDLWAAQRIFQNQPAKHVDIGSRIDGFVAHVAAFRPIEVWDLRPQTASVQNISFRQQDLADPGLSLHAYCDSLSCLSVLEHLGLGRYGDRVDPRGHEIGWANLHRILKPGGRLYFSVPLGRQRIEYDAHRVFSIATLEAMIRGKYEVAAFAYVDDAGCLIQPPAAPALRDRVIGPVRFGCALFELIKRAGS